MRPPIQAVIATCVAGLICFAVIPVVAQTGSSPLRGTAAFGDWHADRPGTRRLIRPQDLPAPDLAASTSNVVRIVRRTDEQKPIVPNGFEVNLFASGLSEPRLIRVAPNGDVFVAESSRDESACCIRCRAPSRDRRCSHPAWSGRSGLRSIPPAQTRNGSMWAIPDSVVRFPYQSGDLKPRGRPEVIVPHLPTGGHYTRDVAFSPDGRTMYVSVGSGSNIGTEMQRISPAEAAKWQADHPLGAAWGEETQRADVLAFDPQGKNSRIYATGIRNCVGMAVAPGTGTVWCSTNERDGLGDNVPPDYITRVREGAFYGWPWYYIGANEDPRHRGERPDLKDKVTIPDVLIEAHSASLGMTFYNATEFPPEYRGSIFAAEHGSWNRSKRTGYKVIRAHHEGRRPDRRI